MVTDKIKNLKINCRVHLTTLLFTLALPTTLSHPMLNALQPLPTTHAAAAEASPTANPTIIIERWRQIHRQPATSSNFLRVNGLSALKEQGTKETMASNPIFSLLWLILLWFLAWPVAFLFAWLWVIFMVRLEIIMRLARLASSPLIAQKPSSCSSALLPL